MEMSPQHRLEYLCVIFGNPLGQLESPTAIDFQSFGKPSQVRRTRNYPTHERISSQMECKTQGDGQ